MRKEPAQFGAWLRRDRAAPVADSPRCAGSAGLGAAPLPEEHEGEEDIWGVTISIPDPTEEVVERSVIDQALGELNEVHRRVVELAGPQDLDSSNGPAKEAAGLVNDQLSGRLSDPMTEANVHQILSRFRKRVAELAWLRRRRPFDVAELERLFAEFVEAHLGGRDPTRGTTSAAWGKAIARSPRS